MADHMLQMKFEMDSLMGAYRIPSPLRTDRMVPLDVSEDDKCYMVAAEVPGFHKSEIKVSLSEDSVLTMTGAHGDGSLAGAEIRKDGEAASKEEGGAMKQSGTPGNVPISACSRCHSFIQSIQLPEGVDLAAVTATIHKGPLTVWIPKVSEQVPKVRDIPVA
ncbi:hypothetical protein VaNZ11_004552 [Volvox africanus]|uniref:SHSP domain-containing protein n=1 Tax=Volvox africanus TaxID=51714 RepID=A0ABQ5RWS0_9CHLO|nr:hypothetical protein VaNZ11_004552 [Volvox africanus]